jgi:hypothetical protein
MGGLFPGPPFCSWLAAAARVTALGEGYAEAIRTPIERVRVGLAVLRVRRGGQAEKHDKGYSELFHGPSFRVRLGW